MLYAKEINGKNEWVSDEEEFLLKLRKDPFSQSAFEYQKSVDDEDQINDAAPTSPGRPPSRSVPRWTIPFDCTLFGHLVVPVRDSARGAGPAIADWIGVP